MDWTTAFKLPKVQEEAFAVAEAAAATETSDVGVAFLVGKARHSVSMAVADMICMPA